MEKLFAVSAPGLEPFTAQELVGLDLLRSGDPGNEIGREMCIAKIASRSDSVTKPEHPDAELGGVEFAGGLEAIYAANLRLRTASRVLLRLGDFNATAFTELRKKAGRLPWERFLKPGQPVQVRVTCHKSRLYHSDAVAERVVGAIGDRLGQVPPYIRSKGESDERDDAPGQLVLVRLVHDHCTISLDTSGELLHRRGYRLASAKAPLRETLAAGMLLAAGWDGETPLLDPFCGSGTIAIEAALLASGAAPGRKRRFAFMDWPGFDQKLWARLLEESNRHVRREPLPWIAASDRDAGAIEMARANAERAGVGAMIEFSQRAVSAIEPQGVGWIVTNPPYGLRVSANKDLRNLYAQLGNVLRAKCPGWHVAILCNDGRLLGQIGLVLDSQLAFVNGGVRVKFARGEVEI